MYGCTARQLARTLRGDQGQLELVGNQGQAIFSSYTGHGKASRSNKELTNSISKPSPARAIDSEPSGVRT
jgi:hypothetical protein